MASRLKVLIVEDVSTDAELELRELKKAGIDYTAVRVDTKRGFLSHLEEFAPDIILSDYTMPEFDGLAALDLAHEKCPDTPFIFISGTIGEEVAIESLKRGAVDYILKTNLKRLGPAVERALQDVTERRARLSAERQLNEARVRFELFMRYLPGAAFIKDWRGRYQFVNWSWEEIRGREMAEVLGRTDGNLWPELAAQFESSEQLVLDRNDALRSIETFPRLDGVHHYLVHRFPILDRDGRPMLVGGIAIDFTDRMQLEAKLLEREAGLHRAQLMAKLAHVITGPDGSFESWSESLPQLTGLDAAQMPSSIHEWLDILHPEDRDRVRAAVINAGVTGAQVEIEYRLRRKDGAWADVRQTIEPLTKEHNAGDRIRWFNTFQDVSEQKRAQEKIARLNRIHAVLSGINTLIVRVRDRHELFNEACRIAVEHGQFGMVWIGLLNREEQEVQTVAHHGFPSDFAEISFSLQDENIEQCYPVVRVISEGQPFYDNNIDSQPGLNPIRQAAVALGYRSLAVLPLAIEKAGVGAMFLYAKEPGFFDNAEIILLTELAGDISFALENIRKEEKLARLSRIQAVMSNINALIVRARDREKLFSGACRVAVEHGKFELVWIGTLDPATQDVTPVAWAGEGAEEVTRAKSSARDDSPRGKGAVGQAIRERRPVVNNDIAARAFGGPRLKDILRLGFRSQITLPLFEGQTVVGTLTMYAREPNFFDEEELRLLTELAGNISFALENIAKEVRIARLGRIQAVTSNINSMQVRVRDRQELFNEACRIAVEHGRFLMAWIGLVDRDNAVVRPVATAGDVRDYFDTAPTAIFENKPDGHGLSGRAIRAMKPMVSNDVKNDPQLIMRKELDERGINSFAICPLIVAGEAVGVLALYAAEVGAFDEQEMRLLLELASDISFALEHIGKEEKLNYLAYYDALTGLPNRTLLIERLSQSLQRARRDGNRVSLVLRDLTRFRNINETLGRGAGDTLLCEFAKRLQAISSEAGHVARIGPDCFAMILSDVTAPSEIAHLTDTASAGLLSQPFVLGEKAITVSTICGIAVFPTDGEDPETLLRNAEAALKKAKAAKEKYLFYHSQMNAAVAETLLLENKLRGAIEHEQFVLHYQPKIDTLTGQLSGLEALIRWNDTETGLVPPVKFIPLLEETGMILEVGAWAISKAISVRRELLAKDLHCPRIAVNVSAIQLQQKDFVEVVRRAIEECPGECGKDACGLDLEITESLIMRDIESNIAKFTALEELGIKIAIDDFGTGYSSLSYLARLPVDTLKIDRSFINSMAKNADSMSIVSTIISLAHSLNMKVTAEGVETEEQAKFLRLLKCDEMQGYLFSKPLPVEQLTKMLEERRAT
jgi:diguanylate cyclase (GGDEF)-like protein/PAS domain S-box-containing protein